MTLGTVRLLIVAIDGHHARSTGSNVRLVVHWRQLHPRLIVDFTLADIRAVQHVIVVVQSHQARLLLAYLLLLEVRTALALVALHLMSQVVDAAARVLHQIRLADVCVTLRIRRRHAFANAVVLGEVASLLGRTAVHAVIIILSLCAALAARLVVEVHRR